MTPTRIDAIVALSVVWYRSTRKWWGLKEQQKIC